MSPVSPQTKSARIRELAAAHPDMSHAEIARRVGCAQALVAQAQRALHPTPGQPRKHRVSLSITLPAAMGDALRAQAKRRGCSISELVERAIAGDAD